MQITREGLIKDIKERNLHTLTLVHTDEAFFIEEILGHLRETFGLEGGWGYEVLECSIVDARSLTASAGTLSFGGTTKATVIRSAQRLKKDQMDALARISSGNSKERIVVLLADKTLKASDSIIKWAKETGAAVCHIPIPKPQELSRWLESRASEKGVTLDARTAGFMTDMVSGNLMALDQMLEKIDLYRGKKGQIGIEDLEELLADSFEKGIYDCVKAVFAIGQGKIPSALREKATDEMHRVLRYGVNEGVLEITRALAREAFSLLKYVELHSLGLRRDAIAAKMKLGPRKWLLEKEYPDRARKWPRERLHNLLIRLSEVDLAVRTTGRDAEAMLEQVIIGNLAPTSVEEYDEIFL